MRFLVSLALTLATASLLTGCAAEKPARTASAGSSTDAPPSVTIARAPGHIVAMRRLTEAQYRASIADIFGPDIKVAGRFEPIVRPVHELIATGAVDASISPAGFEAFDAIGRNIAAQVFDDAHRDRFMACAPRDPALPDPACAAQVLTPIGRYLFRRPMSKAERAFYVKLASDGAGPTKSFAKGLELALSAMLVSPRFLYVVETAEADPAVRGGLRLDNYSRASRLSFLLWNTTPNDMLLDAAAAGRLTDPAQLDAIAAQMVKSPRMEQGVRAFFADMLLFEKFDEISKDPIIFPYFNAAVAQALPEQMLRTITDHLLVQNGDYRGLFTTPHTFMTRSIGGLYQVPVRVKTGWEPYSFAPGDDRAGLLGQAGFLALYSQSGRSSPTLRGRAVRELLMCQPVPNPPGNVDFSALQNTSNKAMPTARIRLSAHAENPVCAGCHKITDPIGLALEKFDGNGAFRATENGAAIDVTGTMNGQSFAGGMALGKVIANDPSTTECVATRALSYATGRSSEDAEPLVEPVVKSFAEQGYGIRALFLRVATMPETYRVAVKPLQTAPARVAIVHPPARLSMASNQNINRGE